MERSPWSYHDRVVGWSLQHFRNTYKTYEGIYLLFQNFSMGRYSIPTIPTISYRSVSSVQSGHVCSLRSEYDHPTTSQVVSVSAFTPIYVNFQHVVWERSRVIATQCMDW